MYQINTAYHSLSYTLSRALFMARDYAVYPRHVCQSDAMEGTL